MFWIIFWCVIVFVVLAIVYFTLPEDQVARPRKKKEKKTEPKPQVPVDTKDWKSIAERWERQNQSLHGEIEKMKMDQKRVQQSTDELKDENKSLVDKLALEKSWREKEQATLERSKQHEKDLKDQIHRTEADLEKEHSNRLRLERELQDLKIKHDEIVEEKRQAVVKSSSLETTVAAQIKQIRELIKDNARLKEVREDIQWVAKSEFDELKKTLAAKEEELKRLKEKS